MAGPMTKWLHWHASWDMSLDDRGLSTDILLGESGDWEYLYKVKGDANRSNIFSAFFITRLFRLRG